MYISFFNNMYDKLAKMLFSIQAKLMFLVSLQSILEYDQV
jgi:hypothetical protein